MKKTIATALILGLLLGILPGAAQGVTLKTTSIFTGADAAADTYLGLLKDWQERTGNVVVDVSSTSDEAWKTGVLNDFAAGNEPDVLFYFNGVDANTIVEAGKVVSLEEIRAEYPDYASNMKEDMIFIIIIILRIQIVIGILRYI